MILISALSRASGEFFFWNKRNNCLTSNPKFATLYNSTYPAMEDLTLAREYIKSHPEANFVIAMDTKGDTLQSNCQVQWKSSIKSIKSINSAQFN